MRSRSAMPALALLAAAPVLAGSPELQLDLNSLTVSASPPELTGDYTGTLTIASDLNSDLVGILVDGAFQTFRSFALVQLDGEITLEDGVPVGGCFHAVVANSDNSMSAYCAEIVPDIGSISTFPFGGAVVDMLTEEGLFTTGQFADFDVSPWRDTQPLAGAALMFQFSPDAGGVDADTDLDLFVQQGDPPAPSADLDGDGVVGSADLGILLAAWGPLP